MTKDKIYELKEDIKSGNPPDIIAITEIKPKNYTRELAKIDYKIDGYRFEEVNLSKRDSTRGVALYIRESLNCSLIEAHKIVDNSNAPTEVISAELRLDHNERMILSTIYRSPNSDKQENNNINNFFRNIGKLKHQHQLILGDYNRKDIKWDTVSSSSDDDNKFIDAIRDAYLTQHVSLPTRGRGSDEPSLVDLVFTSNEQNVESLEIFAPLGKSDHSVIKILYRSKPEKLADKIISDYTKADFGRLKEVLDIDWAAYFQDCNDDIDKVWETFITKFMEAERNCIPKKIVKTCKKKFSFTLDKKTLAKKKKKYRLWKRFLSTKDAKIYEDYCRCRNQLRRLTRKAVKLQEQKVASKAKSNNKIFWKFINSKTKMRNAIPELFTTKANDTKNMTNDDHEKANILGKYFSSVYTKEPDWTWDLNQEDKPHIREELQLEITKEVISKKLGVLNVNKSPGPDTMHPRVVKEVAQMLIDPFFIIYQLSIKLGKIPKAWKLATVSAIFKNKGCKHNPENFRPISLTSIACKMLESIIRDSVLAYLKANAILSDKQFGFLGGRSTVLQLLRVIDSWTEILDNGGIIDTIYCDFQKAFDTVPHNRLLDLVEHYGIKDPILSWVRDFLSNRKQQVSVNGAK